jgi:NADH-quinone oxidoreductase subunit G
MVEIKINGKKVKVQEGSMIMDAAREIGTYIPHFCYHKKLSIAANCRMCLVDIEKIPKALPACATPVVEGMVVRTESEKATAAQKSVMEFLLINHPLDCPICDQGGECQLQDLSVGYGKSSSRYEEEKRVVVPKDAGPLISMQEMNRCIQCTRCVRFGQEIAGIMEFGMVGRGEHSEISTFVGKTVSSELSGNMIDLCPVGALTSKPFRYSARNWELSRRKSISPHDSLGTNLTIQVKSSSVMRVTPLENNDINECWISDKDRFSYEGLNSSDRLTKPMIKQNGKWQEVNWDTALNYVKDGLRNICLEHGADMVASVGTPYSTLEELRLLQKLTRGMGSENVDFRLRQSDFSLDSEIVPWLGMSINKFSKLDRVFIIGSFLCKDHPLVSARLRLSAKRGAEVNILHATDDDLLMPITNKMIIAPSDWLSILCQVAAAVARIKGTATPLGLEKIDVLPKSSKIAESLLTGENKAILLGNSAAQHPHSSKLHATAQWIADRTGAKFGYLTEAANTVGGYLAGAKPTSGIGGRNARQIFAQQHKAYILLNAEPGIDSFNPQVAMAALNKADMVVTLSSYKHGTEYSDILLPISPFTETSGTFINCEGRPQSFNGAVRPMGDTRPAWKVLRVLGNLLGLPNFDYDSSEEIRDEVLELGEIAERLNNFSKKQPKLVIQDKSEKLVERIADVPIYHADAIVRRATSLQKTLGGQKPRAWLSSAIAEKLGITEGELVKLIQGQGTAVLVSGIDSSLPENVVRVAASHPSTATLGDMFGPIQVKKND